LEVAGQLGLRAEHAVLLQETNNTVVWLRPEPVIAKVATRPDAKSDVRLEHAIASELAALRSDIAAPLPGSFPVVHLETSFVVTFWQRLDEDAHATVAPDELALSLRKLHLALAQTHTALPSFRTALTRARTALNNASSMSALAPEDLRFLRQVFDDRLAQLDDMTLDEHRLHGEPHDGNRLVTAEGLRWIDFESCCRGPLEWDLAFLATEADGRFPHTDVKLLRLLQQLNSARVATWCWALARLPDMRRHGEMHLALLRTAARS
jgi:Ser/Thr protein kinase RdoA (MazF antagonist)